MSDKLLRTCVFGCAGIDPLASPHGCLALIPPCALRLIDLRMVCDMLVLMFVIGNPFVNFVYASGSFQYLVVLFTMLLTMPWQCASALIRTLSNPFESSHDMLNVDALICSTERTTFQGLRCTWNTFAVSDLLQHEHGQQSSENEPGTDRVGVVGHPGKLSQHRSLPFLGRPLPFQTAVPEEPQDVIDRATPRSMQSKFSSSIQGTDTSWVGYYA